MKNCCLRATKVFRIGAIVLPMGTKGDGRCSPTDLMAEVRPAKKGSGGTGGATCPGCCEAWQASARVAGQAVWRARRQ